MVTVEFDDDSSESIALKMGQPMASDDVSRLLGASWFRVTQSATPERALAALASERFDALVTDYAMPSMDGLQLIAKARCIQPGLAALIISGFAVVDWTRILPDSVAVLHKPFRREQLMEALLARLTGK